MQRRPRAKMNIPMCVAVVLLCLTLITTHMMSGLYAKYVVRDSGGDSARVAKFGDVTIVENGESVGSTYIVAPGTTLKKDVEISFTGSEMACYLFVVLEPTGWSAIANGDEVRGFSAYSLTDENDKDLEYCNIVWSVDETWEYLKADDGKYVYYQKIEPNIKVENQDFIADGEIIVDEYLTMSQINQFAATDNERKLDFTAIVAQYDGVSTSEEMWNKVSGK